MAMTQDPRTSRARRVILAGVILLLAGAFISLRRLHGFLAGEGLRTRVEKSGSEALGGALTIDRLEWIFGPWPRLKAHAVRLQDEDGAEAVFSPAAFVDILPWGLLRGRIDIRRLVVESPDITLRLGPTGSAGTAGAFPWAGALGGKSRERPGADPRFFVREIEIRNASIRALDETALDGPPAWRLLLSGSLATTGAAAFQLAGRFERGGNAADLKASGVINPNPRIRLETADVPLELFAEKVRVLRGSGGRAALTANINKEETGIHWTASGTGGIPASGSLPELRGDFSAASGGKGKVRLVSAAGPPARADILWDFASRASLHVEVDAEEFAFQAAREVFDYLRAPSRRRPAHKPRRPWVLKARAGLFRYGELALRNMTVEAKADDRGEVGVSASQASFAGGIVAAQADIPPFDGSSRDWETRRLKLRAQARGVRVDSFFDDKPWKRLLAGALRGEGSWEGRVSELARARGAGTLRFSFAPGASAAPGPTRTLKTAIDGAAALRADGSWSVNLDAGKAWSLAVKAPLASSGNLDAVFKAEALEIESIVELMKSKTGGTLLAPPGAAQKKRPLTARLSVRQARFRELALEDIDFEVKRSSGGGLHIAGARARSSGGTVRADFDVLPPSPAVPTGAPRFEIRWAVRDVDMERLLTSVGSKYMIAGLGSGTGRLSSSLKWRRWAEGDGSFKVEVKDGSIWNAPAMLKVLSALNLEAIFGKRDGGKEDSLAFKTLRLDAGLSGGQLTVEKPAVLERDSLKVAFTGKYDLAQETIDGLFVVHFLTVFDQVLKAVPGISLIFYQGRKGLMPVWVKVSGPRAAPKVEVLPFRSISEGLWSTIGDALLLPTDLIQKALP